MKWYVSGFCVIGFLIVIYKISDKETPPIVQPMSQLSVSSVSAIHSDQQLLLENRQLRQQVAQLTDEIAKLKQATHNSNAPQPKGEVSNEMSVNTLLVKQSYMREQFREFNDAFAKGQDPIATIKSNFAVEEIDTAWASKNQLQLESFFKDSFTDIFPQYIECRSTRCRITIPVADQKKMSVLSEKLMQGIFHNEKGIARNIVIEPNTNDGTLNFYLARNDEVNLFK